MFDKTVQRFMAQYEFAQGKAVLAAYAAAAQADQVFRDVIAGAADNADRLRKYLARFGPESGMVQ